MHGNRAQDGGAEEAVRHETDNPVRRLARDPSDVDERVQSAMGSVRAARHLDSSPVTPSLPSLPSLPAPVQPPVEQAPPADVDTPIEVRVSPASTLTSLLTIPRSLAPQPVPSAAPHTLTLLFLFVYVPLCACTTGIRLAQPDGGRHRADAAPSRGCVSCRRHSNHGPWYAAGKRGRVQCPRGMELRAPGARIEVRDRHPFTSRDARPAGIQRRLGSPLRQRSELAG